jgi:hypothetical protein
MGLMKKIFGDYSSRELKSIYPIVDKIESMADEYKAMSDEALRAKTTEFKERLQNGETLDDILPEAFATVREAADRVLGRTARVTETIDNDSASGAVYVDGKTWTARSADGSVPAGSRVEIRRMEGVKLIVEAAQKAPDKKEEVV